jgi:uracil-DNA glycosylase family 4
VNREQELKAVEAEVAECSDCILHMSRKLAVPGEGPADSEIVFIGEGPGFHENEQGRPFVGAAGRLLESMLESVGLQRDQVFICNVVKCRPPGNRDPQPEEMEACAKYLERQIRAINPKVIVTLGRFSMARYFPGARISAIHGQEQMKDGRLVMPFYHPAAALHQPKLRSVVEQDFAKMASLLARAQEITPPEADSPADPEQLSMF